MVRDPSAMAALSPPSRVLLATIRTATETALAKPLGEIDTEMVEGLGAGMGTVVVDTIADVVDKIPMVGPIFGAIIKALGALFGSDGGADEAEYCNRFQTAFKPKGTGSMLGGGTMVPADIMAAVHPIPKPTEHDDYWENTSPHANFFVPGVKLYASSLGAALIALTEGMPADERDVTAKKAVMAKSPVLSQSGDLVVGKKKIVAALKKLRPHVIKAYDREYKELHPGAKVGIRAEWRRLFRALRRAIAASHGPKLAKGAKSDGGLSMWPAYLDLLLAERKAGRLPKKYIVYVLQKRGAAYLPNGGQGTHLHHDPVFEDGMFGKQFEPVVGHRGQDVYYPPGHPDRGCTSILADQIVNLLDQWKRTVKPYYEGGQEKLAELEAEAKKIATDSILQAAAKGKIPGMTVTTTKAKVAGVEEDSGLGRLAGWQL